MKTMLSMCALLACLNGAIAMESSGYALGSTSAERVLGQIDDAEWSLRHSSIAESISKNVQDESLALLSRARSEVAAGNFRTAHDLTRRASLPLTRMEAAAMSGKHPDSNEHYEDIRETLVSLIGAGAMIANEKGASSQFVLGAWESVIAADEMAKAGKLGNAKEALLTSYRTVKSEIAGMRAGELYVLGTPQGQGQREWEDGLRRIEERRSISNYLLLEVDANGEDVKPLVAGMEAAERTVAEASRLAAGERWPQALASLEQAYVQYEESWKKVGVEW